MSTLPFIACAMTLASIRYARLPATRVRARMLPNSNRAIEHPMSPDASVSCHGIMSLPACGSILVALKPDPPHSHYQSSEIASYNGRINNKHT